MHLAFPAFVSASAPLPLPALALDPVPEPFRAVSSVAELEPGVWLAEITLTTATSAPAAPVPVTLRWSVPCADLHAHWRGGTSRAGLPPDWSRDTSDARACQSAPVLALFSSQGQNRLTFAVEDALHLSRLYVGVREEDGTVSCRAEFFAGHLAPATSCHARLRLDLRPRPWDATLRDVAAWWEKTYPPVAAPESARRPFYCTWYSLHQHVDAAAVETQAALARELGCEAVIIDDGWQTLYAGRGYGHTGDWKPERIPDMAGLVRRLHARGLQVVLWYSVPFVGFHSANFARFKGRTLFDDARKQCALLDPRYPEVRAFLVELYAEALRAWNLDGFKLDFVDAWQVFGPEMAAQKPGMDFADLDEAVVALLQTVSTRLRALKPDVLLEFRQSYTGPVMRTFGNVFRVGDCPADALRNRVGTLDLRVLAGRTVVQADPVMWSPTEPVESAALQLLNVLFAVPQVSVLLDCLPADHRRMLAFWLGWWREHRACLLDGELRLHHPETRYTHAAATLGDERVVCLYQDVPATVEPAAPRDLWLVNVRREAGLLVEFAAPWSGELTLHTTVGDIVSHAPADFPVGVARLPLPPAGLVRLRRHA